MNKPPGRYEVTVLVAKDDGHQPDPATFAVAAEQGSIEQERKRRQRAHGRGDHLRCLCRRARSAAAIAVALAVVADALRAEDPVPSPSR